MIGKSWYNQRSEVATAIEVTQYGIRLPNGAVHWGDVTQPGQPAHVPFGNTPYTVYAEPGHSGDPERTVDGVRERLRNSMTLALMSEDVIEQHLENVTTVERLVVITFSGTRLTG
jgi:hypothetical protein